MATSLGVARASVVPTYEQLLTEGYVEARTGSGTFVASDIGRLTSTSRRSRSRGPKQLSVHAAVLADFERAQAHSEALPFNTGRTLIDAHTAEVWRKLTHRAVRLLGPDDLGYTDPCGLPQLRRSLCEYLQAARNVRCDPEQIVVTAGTQHAIDIAIRVLLAPGDEVWVETRATRSLTHNCCWPRPDRSQYQWMAKASRSRQGAVSL
jgi:GntR family transcriptional regulator / MocR family aminotransferase